MSKNYKVLWIDDEHVTHGATLKGDALDHDIILVGYTSVDEGFAHLREDLSRYDAILLDAKSFEKKDQQPGTENIRALNVARDHIMALKHEKNYPYFVLTGQKGLQDDETFGQLYQFYKKGSLSEHERLFTEIKTQVDDQPNRQLRSRFQPAFEACQEGIVSELAGRLLVKVLTTVQQPGSNHDDDTQFNNLRKIIEEIFRAAHRYKLLPGACVTASGVNLANCGKILAGTAVQVSNSEFITPTAAAALPRVFKSIVRFCSDLTSNGSHTDATNDTSQLRELREQVKTPYLLAALTYQVLDLLVWFKALVSDPERLATYQNAWITSATTVAEKYVAGTVSKIGPTSGTFIENGKSDRVHIHKSDIDRYNLKEGISIEAVIKPNSRDSSRFEVSKIKVI